MAPCGCELRLIWPFWALWDTEPIEKGDDSTGFGSITRGNLGTATHRGREECGWNPENPLGTPLEKAKMNGKL